MELVPAKRSAVTVFRCEGKNSRFSWAQGFCFLGFGILLALNWPGQMSYDSVVQLWPTAAIGHYDSWHPPVMAWLLGLFDRLVAGHRTCFCFYRALAALRLAVAAAAVRAQVGVL